MENATEIWRSLSRIALLQRGGLDIDLSRASTIDGAIMALLVDTRAHLAARGVTCELLGGSLAVRELVHLYGGDSPPLRSKTAPRRSLIARFGDAVQHLAKRGYALVGFAGELVVALGRAIRRPSSSNLRELPDLVARAGTDGALIVFILNFLVGFVMAYQSTRPLEQYGANLFVADIVGISVTRELAPLMTAVIIAGRSGAAFAAELGTMRVSEEIDALRTMGFSPVSHLVLPRVLALAIAAPVLTLLGDVIGVFGGAVVAASALDVTPRAYLAELRLVLLSSDVWTGLVKSVAFGMLIAFIGCHQGLSARGAASGVGRSTTATVVSCLFTIVVVDTLFTMIFRGVGR